MNAGLGPGGGPSSSMSMSNAIDKETKNLALKIKKCPNFKNYKQYISASQVNLYKQ